MESSTVEKNDGKCHFLGKFGEKVRERKRKEKKKKNVCTCVGSERWDPKRFVGSDILQADL
jgi:hypothetical protein